jgi:hypothetical protein
MTKINNKNIIIIILVVITAMTVTYLITSAVINSKNSDFNKLESINLNLNSSSTDPSGDVKTDKESFGTTTIENNKTKYSDGRFTAVRNLRYYNDLIKMGIPMKDAKFGLTTIMTEWNAYDANVASSQGGFIEKPMFLNEADKKEMREAGIDQSDTLSTMVGGDEETNRRFVEPSKRYWAVASKMFEQEFKNLKKAEGISNRDVDSVTFDFITTSGFYTVQIPKTDLESGKSVWSNMFEESKFLNTEMARVQNESQKDAEKRYEARQLKER